jgi:ABC-type glycerol-3-phosphate transport system permease component
MGPRTSLDVSEERIISHSYRDSIVMTFSPQIISVIITIIVIIIIIIIIIIIAFWLLRYRFCIKDLN